MKIDSNRVLVGLMSFVTNTVGEITVPNYYIGAWECDLYKISLKGFDSEYEIKLSKADFKNDFDKKRSYYRSGDVSKHEIIKEGKRVNRFYFVMPDGLVDLKEIPTYCGVIFFWEQNNELRYRTARGAKLLKKDPVSNEKYKHIAGNLCIKLRIAKAKVSKKRV